jgi:aspartate kinase
MAAAAAAVRTPARLGLDGAVSGEKWLVQRKLRAPVPVAVPAAPCWTRRAAAAVRCQRAAGATIVEKKDAQEGEGSSGAEPELTVVMKFGGSSVASAERMQEVADLILSFPEERPVVVLSAMGKTTNKLLMVLSTPPVP